MSKWLTDKEKRILFSSLTREKSVCIQVDKQCEPREPYEQSLQSVCESLEHKFYYDRLFKQMEKQIRAEAIDDFVKALHLQTKENEKIARLFPPNEYDKITAFVNLDLEEIDTIAEQLKAGVENDKSI